MAIQEHHVWPQPLRAGGAQAAQLSVKLEGRADQLLLRFYTSAFVRVASLSTGPLEPGWNGLRLPAELLAQLPQGVLFYTVEARRGSRSAPRCGLGKILLMR